MKEVSMSSQPIISGGKTGRIARWVVPAVLVGVVACVGLALGLFWIAGRAAEERERPPKVDVEMIHSGDRVPMEQPVLVPVTSMDPEGITQVELWVDGGLVDSETPSDPGTSSPTLSSLSWEPDSPGEHVLMVRTESGDGVVNQEAVVVEVVEDLVSIGPEGEEIYRDDITQVYYAVGEDDTLLDILQLYDVSEAEIVALNPSLEFAAPASGSLVAVPFDVASLSRPGGAPPEEEEEEPPTGGRGGGPPEGPPIVAPNPPDALPPPGDPPDLMITNLTLSNLNPMPGEEVTVGVTIMNVGGTPAENFHWSWGPGTGEGRIRDETPIEYLVPGDDIIREMTYTWQEEGQYTGRARVDPQDHIDEGEEGEDNNVALADITVGEMPPRSADLAITNLTVSNRYPAVGEEIIVGVTIMNLGDAVAENFTWAWGAGTESDEGWIHDETVIEQLAPGDDVIREMAYTYEQEGTFTGSALADSRNAYDEGDREEDNMAHVDVHVGEIAPGQFPDLAITNLTLSALNPRPGEEVVVGVTIANQGGQPAENFYVGWQPDSGSEWIVIEPPIARLDPGDDVVYEFMYVYEKEGHYNARAMADYGYAYPRDDNNNAWADVTVSEDGAIVAEVLGYTGGSLGGAVQDVTELAQDLAGVSPPAAPHIITAEIYEEEGPVSDEIPCYTLLEWRDRSDNEIGFRIYRWDAYSDEFKLIDDLQMTCDVDIVRYYDVVVADYYYPEPGPIWYYVTAYNGGGEAASDYATVEVTPFCAGNLSPVFGTSGAEIEFVGMIVDKQYDSFYCYLSLDESPWFRVPENQNEFMPVEYGPIEDDLFGMGGSGESYYHVNLFDYLGGENSLVIYPSWGESFWLGVECWGWHGGALHNLGTYQKEHPPETWEDEVATGWLEEAHGPDGWFAFWYATRWASWRPWESEPAVFDHSLPAPTDLALEPEDCEWWHDSCSLVWRWDGDIRTIDGFHLEDDDRTLDDVAPPDSPRFPVDPFELFPYPYCAYPNTVEVAPFRDVHQGQAASLDVGADWCGGGAVKTVTFDEIHFGRFYTPGAFDPCVHTSDIHVDKITGFIWVSGVEKRLTFGPVSVGQPQEDTLLLMGGCETLDLGEALPLWNHWVPDGMVYPRLHDNDELIIEWLFFADIHDERTGEYEGVKICEGSETYGPLGVWEWEGFFKQDLQYWGEELYPDPERDPYGCWLSWRID
jgi:hypothetical protein